jgi:hypothetical protein
MEAAVMAALIVILFILLVVSIIATAWLHPRWLLRFIAWATLPQRVVFYRQSPVPIPSSSPSLLRSQERECKAKEESDHLIEPKRKKRVALTIDDAPHGDVTPWLLDELRRYDCRATFFCIGGQVVTASKALLRRMVDEGHELGNHMMRDEATYFSFLLLASSCARL